ncbi:MAG: MFS transporter [Acidobacteriota bacterium]|nr:MFS transporter [Acidobacteriota bacterium]
MEDGFPSHSTIRIPHSMKPATAPETIIAEQPKRSHIARIFHAFTYRDFRLLWFGAFTSSSGTWLQDTALSWVLLQITNDPAYLGYNAFLSTAPILIFTLIGGVLADRFDRRRILIMSQWSQLVFAVTLASLAFFNVQTMLLVTCALTLSFLTGCVQAFGGPAYQSLIPMLVDKKDLPNAIALNSIQFQLARVVGASIGSLPFAIFTNQMLAAAVSFGLNGLSFIAVIFALMSLSVRHIPLTPLGGMRSQLREGLNFVWHQEALRSLTFLAFVSTFLGVQLMTFLPVFARDILKVGASGNFKMVAVSGVGAVLGFLTVAGAGHIPGKGKKTLVMQFCFGLTIIAFTRTQWIGLAYLILLIAGFFMSILFAMIMSLVQLIVEDKMRGRVMSIYMVAFRGGMPLGALVTGFLSKHYLLPSVLLAEGALLSLIAVIFLLSPTKLKKH